MIGKIFITRSGYDPQLGRYVKDPYLGTPPTLGACRPDFRRSVARGDHIFTISGKVPDAGQFVMVGFEVESKIDAVEAYARFPERRLQAREDGQVSGNVIVTRTGEQHQLDDHKNFDRRVSNYIVGTNGTILETDTEIARGRAQTVEALAHILKKDGHTPFEIVGRWGSTLSEEQAHSLKAWLDSLKDPAPL